MRLEDGSDHRGVRESDWLGTGGFKEFLREVLDGDMRLSLTPPGFVYDPRRHSVPNHLGELPEPMWCPRRQYLKLGDPVSRTVRTR